jgi:multidrug efflux pump subunit AcrB
MACAPPAVAPTVTLKATLHLPAGTSLVEVDRTSIRVFDLLITRSNISAIQTVSRRDQCDVYLRIQSDHAVQDLESILRDLSFPAPEISTLATPIPSVTPRYTPVVEVDRKRAADYGIDPQQIDAALTALGPNPSPEKLSALNFATPSGGTVRLADVARLTKSAEPDCIVHTWP